MRRSPLFRSPEVRGSNYEYNYKLTIGANDYYTDEIGNDLKISSNATAENGYAIGSVASSSISGSVAFKGMPERNDKILLYMKTKDSDDWSIIGNWYLKSFEAIERTKVTFSGMDIIGFTDNEYDAPQPGESLIYPSVAAHAAVIQSTLSGLVNETVALQYPAAAPSPAVTSSTSANMRTMLGYIAAMLGTNYQQPFGTDKPSIEYTPFNNGSLTIEASDRQELTYSLPGAAIDGIRVFNTANSGMPVLKPGEALSAYGIYDFGTVLPHSNYMEVVSPYTKSSDDENYKNLVGQKYSTEFSCQKVKMPGVYPCFTNVTFVGFEELNCVISSISYTFTVDGIFANMSGTGQNLSDFKYIGQTAKGLRNRPTFDNTYGVTKITQNSGLQFVYKDNDTGDETSYGFSSQNGGMTSYEGVMSSSKEASSVAVDKSSGTVTVTYSDGHVYKYSAAVTETPSGYNITNETEEWT